MADVLVQRFGCNVRDARLGHGLTQAELARHASLTAVHVSRIERGVREPRLTTIRALALALALDLEPAELLAGID